jgi:hypothetical protein
MHAILRSLAILCGTAAACAADAPESEHPKVGDVYGEIPGKLRGEYAVVLQPDRNEPEWWAGAPSVARDENGVFWMACRMRTPDAPRGLRGYEIRILRSDDGIAFTRVHAIKREDVPIPGFERPALLFDANTGQFKLYACGPWKDGPWCIIKFDDAATPAEFDPKTARPVIVPSEKRYDRDIVPVGYKDPFILIARGRYHAYVIGYIRQNERIFHFTSEDGERWEPVGNPREAIVSLAGWHDFFVRPASVVPVGTGYLFFYEGSKTTWYDPVYNIATGLGFTFDLHRIIDLTPDAPLAVSSTPGEHFATFRYSHWMFVGNELWVYAEVTRPNEGNEVRLIRLGWE